MPGLLRRSELPNRRPSCRLGMAWFAVIVVVGLSNRITLSEGCLASWEGSLTAAIVMFKFRCGLVQELPSVCQSRHDPFLVQLIECLATIILGFFVVLNAGYHENESKIRQPLSYPEVQMLILEQPAKKSTVGTPKHTQGVANVPTTTWHMKNSNGVGYRNTQYPFRYSVGTVPMVIVWNGIGKDVGVPFGQLHKLGFVAKFECFYGLVGIGRSSVAFFVEEVKIIQFFEALDAMDDRIVCGL